MTQAGAVFPPRQKGEAMTDERYVYTQDQRERKRTATGAMARKGGSKSKRCTMPSDHMTAAQKQKLSGPVERVSLNRPMTYAELKQLSPTLQILYLDHLVNAHHARRADLLAMLGIAPSTLHLLMKALPGKLIFKGRPRQPHPQWIAFMSQEPVAVEAAQPPQEAAQTLEETTTATTPVKPEKAPVAPDAPHTPILAGSITVRCAAKDIIAALTRVLDHPEQSYTFTVNFTK